MDRYELAKGDGRTEVNISACFMGNDLIVRIYNEKAHIGAVAVGEYDHAEGRTSISVITRLGHKDDVIAQKVAYSIAKQTKNPVCVIAGVHIDDITEEEINKVLTNTQALADEFINNRLEGQINNI